MDSPAFSTKFALQLLKESASDFIEDNCLRLSAALSYYSVFSLAPLLLIAIGIAGSIFGPEAAQGQIEAQLTSVMGWEAAKATNELVKSASESGGGGATLVGFVTLLVGASTVFGQLKGALDTVWQVQPKPNLGVSGFIKTYVLTFGMVLVIGFLLLISLMLATIVTAFSKWLESHLGLPPFAVAIFGFVLPLIVETALFALIFKVLPSANVEWRSVWVGAIFTSILFELGKLGLSFYLGRASTTSSFGAAGSLVIILLWVYYGSLILLFGAEMTRVYAKLSGHAIRPSADAESTKLECGGGISPRPALAKDLPAEPSPLASDPTTPPAPARETLTPLISKNVLPDPLHAKRAAEDHAHSHKWQTRAQLVLKRLHENPVAEVAAALGVGLAAGLISRWTEKENLSAAEHFRLGAEDVTNRSQTWLSEKLQQAAHGFGRLTR